MTLERKLAKFLGGTRLGEGSVRGEFPLFEAEGRVWEFERPSLSPGQKFRFSKRKGYFSASAN
jgi:hypothetical protein